MQGSARIDELRQKFHENPRRYFAPLANEYRKAGDPEQAIAICRAHLAQQPAHMSGHVVYAQALYDAGRVDESRVVFEKALSLDPDNAIVLRQLGDISRQKGDAPEARHWYTRALDTDPHNREIAAYIAELTEPLTDINTAEPRSESVPAIETAQAEEVADAPASEIDSTPDVDIDGTPEVDIDTAPAEEIEAAPAEEVEAAASEETETAPAEEIDTAPAEEIDVVSQGTTDYSAASEEIDAAPTSEPAPSPDVEIAIPWMDEPPAIADMPGFEVDEALFAADPDIELFPDSSSPFVTRTMAELYARQGYNDQALEVYRKLAADNPDDQEIADRIRDLSSPDSAPSDEPAPAVSEAPTAVNEFSEPDDSSDSVFGPFDNVDDSTDSPDIVDSATMETTAEPAGPAGSPEKPFHFSDTDLGDGDEWDADSWTAGFSSEEVTPLDFGSSDQEVPNEEISEPVAVEPSVPEPEELPEPAAEADEVTTESAPEDDRHEYVYRPGDTLKRPEPEPAREPMTDEPTVETAAPVPFAFSAEEVVIIEEVWRPLEEPLPEEELVYLTPEEDSPSEPVAAASAEPEHFVAYSPQPPEDEDLPHYSPVGPTIREFFAVLGTHQPPTNAAASFTARAAVPEISPEPPKHSSKVAETQPQGADEFSLPSDAFANLFPDSPVSEDDTRAAFALSGALSSQPVPPPPTSYVDPPPTPPPQTAAQPSGTQESEEDIRRFREWLDGLADS